MLKKLLLGAAVVALSGCATVGEVFVNGTNAAYVLDQNGGSVEALILKADLTDAEIKTVIDARETISDLREKFRNVEPANLLLLHTDYYQAKSAYEAVYSVVVAHESEYTAEEWQAFKDAHAAAVKLDDAVNDYILSSKTSEAANMTLQYLNAAAKLAALL
ncbi:MAG: hypothetical protein ACPHUL_00240 [Marinomonas gallaica]